MGRLIDADELKTAFPLGESVKTECVRATIDHMPTIEPERNNVKLIAELKPCPYRVYGERRASTTIYGEYTYAEYFMPCLKKSCPCFHTDCGDCWCDRNGSYMRLGKEGETDEHTSK